MPFSYRLINARYVWSDFGGKRDGFHETAEDTACREFSEETLGLWGGMGDLQTRVANSIANIKSKVVRALCGNGCFVLKNGLYINFVIPVQVKSILFYLSYNIITLSEQYVDPLLFQLARDENDLLMASRPDSPTLPTSSMLPSTESAREEATPNGLHHK